MVYRGRVPREVVRRLVVGCLARDDASALQLVELFRQQVFAYCYRMLGQREDAEDAAQESFVRALRSIRRWDATRDFEPWLLAIVANRCRTALAGRRRRPELAPLPESALVAARASRHADQLREELVVVLQKLRPEDRQAFVLFHEHQLSYEEVSQLMQCPVGTVKSRVHRARRELVRQLQRRGIVSELGHAVR